MDPPKLYSELASWWPLLSAPSEYEQEAATHIALLQRHAARAVRDVLELGSGGGNSASHMKKAFAMTLVDLSASMLAVSERLNPDCRHVEGDMRDVRLECQFDAVFVHDAVQYMTTLDDLRSVIATARLHLRDGGVALFVPDYVRETFAPGVESGGHDADDGSGLRYLEWVWDPDPKDTSFLVDFAYLLRGRDGSTRVVHDRHHEGLFDRATWSRVFTEAGFSEVREIEEAADIGWAPRVLFVGSV